MNLESYCKRVIHNYVPLRERQIDACSDERGLTNLDALGDRAECDGAEHAMWAELAESADGGEHHQSQERSKHLQW